VQADLRTITHRNTGGLLSPVLQSEDAEISATGYVYSRRVNAEDATFFLWTIFGMKG
jgi:hypothetical protein